MKPEGRFKRFFQEYEDIVKGQEKAGILILSAFLSEGHVLLEGLPGTGKTTLALTICKLLGLNFGRLQGTSDVLPADITGAYIPDREGRGFVLLKGPIFSDILLVDEINRMNPRTQSALLEAMEERQVTIEGRTHHLSPFFFVIATQNPLESHGTFPLPASELDRFMVRIDINPVNEVLEREIVRGQDTRAKIKKLSPLFDKDTVSSFVKESRRVYVDSQIEDYIFRLAEGIRRHPVFSNALSTRGIIHLYRMSRAHAYVMGRDFVVPDDVKSVIDNVVLHRVALHLPYSEKKKILDEIKKSVKAPL